MIAPFFTARWLFYLLLFCWLPLLSFAATNRPNILFLFADDQRADTIRALGNRHIETPNLDRLVRRGTSFTQAYCMGSMSGAVCVPSRAMLMTGRTLFRATQTPTTGAIPANWPMWPEVFRQHGYQTIGIGKWHNDHASYNRAFSGGGPVFFGGMADQSRIRVFDYNPDGEYPLRRQKLVRQFSTGLFADTAIEFIQERSQSPFVLYVAFTVPHDPRTPPAPFSSRYDSAAMPLPPNFLPEHPFDNGELNVRDELLLPTPRQPEAVQDELAAYYGLITHMDAQIGRILAALAESGQEGNTIVVFAADNGLALGSHGLLGKQNLYEHSVRVPLVMAGPGIPKGRKSDALCYLLDVAPTLHELAGVPAAASFEGKSLTAAFKNNAEPVRDSIFCAYKDLQRSIRDREWKLIWYPKTDVRQLFHLAADPHETNDVAAAAANLSRLLNLRERMRGWQEQLSDPLGSRDALDFSTVARPVMNQPLNATVSVDVAAPEGRISPLLYGQFIEFMFEGIKGGLHAELIRNRGFEDAPDNLGLSRYWERYPDDRNDDYGIHFHWDADDAYPAERKRREHSLRVDTTNAVIPRHGVFQAGIPIREGTDYVGYLWLKGRKFYGRVSVALEADRSDGEIYAQSGLGQPGESWQQFRFRLRPGKGDPLARFAVLVEGRGRVWIDHVSLMSADATNDVRADVFAKTVELQPSFIRWPGGNVAQDYHWQWGIGPRDGRVTWKNLSWKNEPEPSDFGTDEFISFCRSLRAEPSITVNVDGRGATDREAAAWVEYCNGAKETPFGRTRSGNGHAQPFGITWWEIGNEIWGPWVRGHTGARTYARRAKRYIEKMRRVDPSIKCIAVGDNDMDWNRTVLEIAGEHIDLLAIHHYYTARQTRNDRLNLMARPLHYERFYAQMRGLLRATQPHRDIRLAINEWGLDLPAARQYSIEAALYGARLMNVFERNSDVIEMSAVSDLVNGWPGGIIQASRHGLFVTPIYLANKLYAQNLGAERLRIAVDSPVFDSSLEGKDVPYLDAVASRSADTKSVYIKLVNTHLTNALPVTVHLSNAQAISSAELHTLSAPSLQAVNGFNTPDAVKITSATLAADAPLSFEMPRHSVSVLKVQVP